MNVSLSSMTRRQTIRAVTYQIKVENEFATDWMVLNLGMTKLPFYTLILYIGAKQATMFTFQ